MYQLAINTSTAQAQLALFKDQIFIKETSWVKEKSHSEVITQAYTELINDVDPQQISAVYCVNGPGSFTGLRVGVNFAKALAYSLSRPLYSINALSLFALSAMNEKGPLLSVMDSQKNSVFLALWNQKRENQFFNEVVPISQLDQVIKEPLICTGPGLLHYKEFMAEEIVSQINFKWSEEPADLKRLFTYSDFLNCDEFTWDTFKILYIKGSAPEEKLNPTLFKS
jgi:tRNA threonylcarbamoyl adenosine modification protein YeaZ